MSERARTAREQRKAIDERRPASSSPTVIKGGARARPSSLHSVGTSSSEREREQASERTSDCAEHKLRRLHKQSTQQVAATATMHRATAVAAVVVLLAIVVAPPTLAISGGDPCGSPEWRYSPFSNKCYRLFNVQTGWVASEFKCLFAGGGHHISIHDAANNQFVAGQFFCLFFLHLFSFYFDLIVELAKQAGTVWLGAVQYGGSKDYTWVDRSPFGDYENWQHGSRPPYHKGKKCTKLDGNTGRWLQSCCRKVAAYICQKPALRLPGEIEEDGR